MKRLPLWRAYMLMLCCIYMLSCSDDQSEILDLVTETEAVDTPQDNPVENPAEEPSTDTSGSTSCTGTSDAIHQEKDGVLVIEAENTTLNTNWSKERSVSGFSGTDYIVWKGGNYFHDPGNGILTYKLRISEAGTYRFLYRSKVGAGSNSTEHNDTWVRFPDATDFFAKRGTTVLYPKGSGKTPNPDGGGAEGWFKAYLSGTTGWTWSTLTNDGSGYDIYVTFDKAGDYILELSARSAYHLVDRIVLFKDGTGLEAATDLNRALSSTVCK